MTQLDVKYASPTARNLKTLETLPERVTERAQSIKLETERSPSGIEMNEERLQRLMKAKERRE